MATSFKQSGCSPVDKFIASVAVSAEQIALVAHPDLSFAAAADEDYTALTDRPYQMWKGNLDLARRVNEFLCRER